MPTQTKEHCGVFGVYGHAHAAELTYLGLRALQHRGQESAGIMSSDGRDTHLHKGLGLVSEVFSDPESLKGLKGSLAIGHNRYSTAGDTSLANAQPLLVHCKGSPRRRPHGTGPAKAAGLKAHS